MPTLYNHTLHTTADQFAGHNQTKYVETLRDGGLNSARALAIAVAGDRLQLDPRLKNETFPFLQEHLGEFGLATEAEIIWSVDPKVAMEYPKHYLSPYSFVEAFNAVRPDDRRRFATRMANDKNAFIAFCEAHGYPVPKTISSNRYAEPGTFQNVKLPAYVKAARSAAGVSIFRCETVAELKYSAEKAGHDFQIQEEVVGVLAFQNVQYQTTKGATEHLATTDQLLNGYAHIGNRFPSAYDPRAITDPLSRAMASLGLKDVFAFDVAVTADQMFIIECNARWNGSTAPTKAMARLGLTAWTACNVDTELESPLDIKLGDTAYSKAKGYGAIVLNTAFMRADGKATVVLTGQPEAQAETYVKLREVFKIPLASREEMVMLGGTNVSIEAATPYDNLLGGVDTQA